MICIYKITNKVTGKFYIGRTKNFKHRISQHKHRMKKGIHGNSCLNNACAKYGLDNFDFIVLEECTLENIIEREQFYIDTLCIPNWDNCYNQSKSSSDGGNLMSEENKKALSKRSKTYIGNKNPNWKGGISKSNCKNCNKVIKAKNKAFCKECYFKQRDITGKNNPFYGKTHSKETKEKLSKIHKGKYNEKQCRPVIIEGVEYYSQSEAARKLQVDIKTISWRIKSKNQKFKNYFYK